MAVMALTQQPQETQPPSAPHTQALLCASPSGFVAFKGDAQAPCHTSDPTARALGTDYDF